MRRQFTVLYQTVEDGWVMATVPELPGAVTQGRDLAEAESMIREAVQLLVASYHDHAAQHAAPGARWSTLDIELPAA